MSSVSSAGASIITLQFGLDLTLDVAEQEVQAAINAAGNLLPSDLPAPPVYAKVTPADAPILTLALSSKTLPLTQVEDLADTRMAAQISQVAGVGLVSISGGQRPAVRVQANPRALAAYALSLESLRTALSSANVNGSKGSVDGPTRQYTLNANDQLGSTQEFSDLVVAYRNGRADPPWQRRDHHQRRGKHAAWSVQQRHPVGDLEHPAAAGSQRDRGGGPDQGADAAKLLRHRRLSPEDQARRARFSASPRRLGHPPPPTAPSPSAPRSATWSSS